MESKELRIGNYIKYRDSIYCIKSWRELRTIEEYRQDGLGSEFAPMPLDAELLVKCGFVFADEHRCYLPYGFMPRAGFKIELGKHTDLKYGVYWHVYCANYPVDIYYLHQLQNLYFALCGQDLPVTM